MLNKLMEENNLKKLLYNEVTFVLALVGIISTFIFWVTNPANVLSQRVGSLETTMEYQSDMLEEIKLKVGVIETRQIEVLQAIARLESK